MDEPKDEDEDGDEDEDEDADEAEDVQPLATSRAHSSVAFFCLLLFCAVMCRAKSISGLGKTPTPESKSKSKSMPRTYSLLATTTTTANGCWMGWMGLGRAKT
ncbi:hypothetical protein ACLKA6_018091 [Drosophila palustris]